MPDAADRRPPLAGALPTGNPTGAATDDPVEAASAEPVWLAEARSHCAGRRFARIDWVAATGSTNADLAARARADAAAPEAALVADHQHAGRGRLDRRWEAPAGASLLVSVLVRPVGPDGPVGPERWPTATVAAMVAMADAVLAVAGVRSGLRWPNDLLVADGPAPGKLAGVLAEAVTGPGAPPALVVGVGCNAAWPPDAAAGADLGATSLAACSGRAVDRGRLLAAFLTRFEHWLEVWRDDPEALRAAHRARSLTVGRPVRVRVAGGETVEGTAVDVEVDGAVVVDTAAGRRTFAGADVEHLRPA